MKNGLLAGIANMPAFLAAIDTQTLITIISAIVLPIVFFSVGKGIDVFLQLRLRHLDRGKKSEDHDQIDH